MAVVADVTGNAREGQECSHAGTEDSQLDGESASGTGAPASLEGLP